MLRRSSHRGALAGTAPTACGEEGDEPHDAHRHRQEDRGLRSCSQDLLDSGDIGAMVRELICTASDAVQISSRQCELDATQLDRLSRLAVERYAAQQP